MSSARKDLNWRAHLTPEELAVIRASDLALATIKKVKQTFERRWGHQRKLIVNRGIKRAKVAARSREKANG